MSVTYRPLQGAAGKGIRSLSGFSPGPIFSDAVRVEVGTGALVLVSGKIGASALSTPPGTMSAQTSDIFKAIEKTLSVEGGSLADIVRMRIFVTDISDEAVRAIHEVRAELFEPGRYPASTLVQVSGFVIPHALIEIEVEAFIVSQAGG
jgi:enamine deaminase RidA (YjgF/YER057c/UK114 family)